MEATATNLETSYTDDGQPGREARGRQIAASSKIKKVGRKFAVPSQSGAASGYMVDLVEQTCTCPDYELRREPCKHQHAVLFSIAWESSVDADGATTESVKVTRKRDRKSVV